MLHATRVATLATTFLMVAIAVACTSEGSPRVVMDGGGEFTATATPTSEGTSSPTGSVTPSPAATSEGTSTPAPPGTPTGTPSATGTATPTAAAGDHPADDLPGMPHSTSDVGRAMAAAGVGFATLAGDAEPLCPQTNVPEYPFYAADTDGADFGPVFVLWVYPDTEAMAEDWDPGSDGLQPRTGCDLPSGFVYWNANTVLAFSRWAGDVEPGGPSGQTVRGHPAVEAYLGLSR
ncbi:MAG: hypothetical protein M0R73_02850 [Dehalococcoidia bacterium]|nr:hypothetical protein [Dehalococcoidia bacterium]